MSFYTAKLAPEMLERAIVERRVLRACMTIRSLPDKERRFLYSATQNSLWRETVQEWDGYGVEECKIWFGALDISPIIPAAMA
jgi:hypothetical protein